MLDDGSRVPRTWMQSMKNEMMKIKVFLMVAKLDEFTGESF